MTFDSAGVARERSNFAFRPAISGKASTMGGLAAGTVVLTMEGEMPVEYLSAGDRIITRDAGMVRLEAMTFETVTVRAVSIAAGSLGDMRPDCDLVLPADQAVLVRDWRAKAMRGAGQTMIPAGDLVDGEFIRDLGDVELQLIRLHFARPHVIYAGGLELGTEAAQQPALAAA